MANNDDQQVSEKDYLKSLREAENRGLLETLTPTEKAMLAKKTPAAFKSERQELLKPKKDILKKTPDPTSLVDQLLAPVYEFGGALAEPVVSAVDNPLEAAANVAIGVGRAINPLPLLNLPNKINPYDADLPTDFETFTSIFNFPIIRGSELAARMFINEEDRPPLTTFSELAGHQRKTNEELSFVTPGIQEGTELGLAVGGATQLVSGGIKLAQSLARNAPGAVRKLIAMRKQKKATKSVKKLRKLADELIREGEGPFLDAIIERPENVERIVRQSEDITITDIKTQLLEEVEGIFAGLGKRVGKFRDAAFKDNKTIIEIPEEIAPLLRSIRERTTFQGESVLPSKLKKQLDAAEKMVALGRTTPNQAMVWVDVLDDIISFGGSGNSGSNAVKSANIALLRTRNAAKGALRNSSDDAEAWAKADDILQTAFTEGRGLVNSLQRDSSDSLVTNLFNKTKTPLRGRLERFLNLKEELDPAAGGHGNLFFSRLADIKAAGKIKGAKLQIDDPTQDRMNRILDMWVKRGERYGQTAGLAIGGGGGFFGSGGGGVLTSLSGGTGLLAGRSIGAEVGRYVGGRMANPMRILKQAKKAKALSKDAKSLASDMAFMFEKIGPQAPIVFLDLIGPLPAVNELIKFSEKERNK